MNIPAIMLPTLAALHVSSTAHAWLARYSEPNAWLSYPVSAMNTPTQGGHCSTPKLNLHTAFPQTLNCYNQ